VNVKRSENFKLMTDINTVSLSGVLVADVEMSKAKGISVARFFVDVEGAGDQRAWGNFKVLPLMSGLRSLRSCREEIR